VVGALRHSIVVATALVGIGPATTTQAAGPSFDQCILDHMQGATSDLAAVSIKEACIHANEKQIPDDALETLMTSKAGFGSLPFPNQTKSGLYVTLNNNSGYTLTELVIEITDKNTKAAERYVIRLFPFVPAPGVIMGAPLDKTTLEMVPPGPRQFYIEINQTVKTASHWFDFYDWNLISAKGFEN